MKKLKRRAGETLMEVLTAMAVFGIIIGGISDFVANQTIALARAKGRERIMYYTQRWISSGDYSLDVAEGGNISFDLAADGLLTVTRGSENSKSSMEFRLPQVTIPTH